LPLELLYADDLILMAESEESLREKIVKRKSGLEAKGLKMNTGKMKVMFGCSMKNRVEEKVLTFLFHPAGFPPSKRGGDPVSPKFFGNPYLHPYDLA